MLAYKPATVKEQKLINNLNKPIRQTDYNSEWYTTKEDKFYMSISVIAFIIILALTL